jgi:hypothetical protein
VRFGTEEVDGVHLGVGLSTIFDALDSCGVAWSVEELHDERTTRQRLTSNIAVEDVVGFDNIVHDLFGVLVHYQTFPLWFAAICVSISVDR